MPKRARKGPRAKPSTRTRSLLSYLLSLVENPDFRQESAEAVVRTTGGGSRLSDAAQWEKFWPVYCQTTLIPFIRKWRVLPLWEMELVAPDPRQTPTLAIRTGRWGLIPVFPWTTHTEIRAVTRRIWRAVGRQRRDTEKRRRAALAAWLTMHGIPRCEIARAVWERKTGLRRPTKAAAIRRLPETRERELLERFKRQGLSNREAERKVYRAARGPEARAVATVRVAVARYDQAGARLTEDLLVPKQHDPLGYILTRIFQADLDGDPAEVSRLLRDLRLILVQSR